MSTSIQTEPSTTNTSDVPVSPVTATASRAATFPLPSQPDSSSASSAAPSSSTFSAVASGVLPVKQLNSEPLELDSTPVSADAVTGGTRRASTFTPGMDVGGDVDSAVWGGADGESGDGGLREHRAALLSSRKADPAVLVDIPQTPGAEELAVAAVVEAGPEGDADGVVDGSAPAAGSTAG